MSTFKNEHDEVCRQQKEKFINLLQQFDRPGMNDLLNMIVTSDFFDAPASANYHNAVPGGLCDHSLKVYDLVLNKIELFHEKVVGKYSPEELAISALLHDVCKIGNYEVITKWRKDARNKWESYKGYGYRDNELPIGHGAKSIIILQQYIALTKSEILAILWHMGLPQEQQAQYEYSAANAMCPLVTILHTADVEAAYILETRGIQEHLF